MRRKRELDGYYFRVKRDDKWQNICFSDLTREEMQEVGENKDAKWWKSLAMGLAEDLYAIGEQFDIERVIPED